MACQNDFFGLLLITAVIISDKGLITHRQAESLSDICQWWWTCRLIRQWFAVCVLCPEYWDAKEPYNHQFLDVLVVIILIFDLFDFLSSNSGKNEL